MSSAKVAPAKGLLQRLDLIYFFLAGIDLLTICIALFLGHLTVTAFEEGVRTSAVWSQRQADIIHLQRLAQIADAPGNDIFYSRDTALERGRFEPALAEFNSDLARISRKIRADTLSTRDAEIVRRLEAIQQTMNQMAGETEIIFREFERGRELRSSRAMAVMDRTYALLGGEMDEALAVVEAGRSQHLETQLARARSLRQLEILIGVAVLFIVGLVATYGAYMGRVLRSSEAQRTAMLAELALQRERLEHYADDVSHELRGPISKMRLDAEVLLQVDRTAQQYRGGVESILIECQRLSMIVESLLFLARAEHTKTSIGRAPLNARRELETLREFFAPAAEQAGIALSVNAGKGVVWADRSLFQRAVSNLVSNALAHTKAGDAIVLSAAETAVDTTIAVQDSGSGIAPDLLPRVFDRFQRGEGKKDGAGLGLGLAITKSIMELHGGSIEISARRERGVEARLRFPAVQTN
jgi:signal transduction histidine kinase